MNRALAVLAVGAYCTLLLGAGRTAAPGLMAALGAVFTLLATAGFLWVQRRTGRRRRWLAAGYVIGQLTLAVLIFGLAPTVGATLLLVVLVSQSVLLLPLWAAAAVAAMGPLVHLGMTWQDALREGIGTLAAFVFTVVVTELLRRAQQARAELAAANEQLRDHAAQAERLATIEERNRLARDIHDGLGHHLTVVQMQVQAARAVLRSDPEQADAVLAKTQQQACGALAEVRRSVAALREPRVAAPLPDALAELAAATTAAGVPAELTVTGTPRALPVDVEESLFRVAQEGLTNVRKHAQASRAELVLDFGGPDTVAVTVHDDGIGAVDPPGGGFGLVGLRERAARVGGRLVVDSSPGQGVTLRVDIPG